MKTLYLECNMGAAGDMLTAALLELLENQEEVIQELNNMGIPGVEFIREHSIKCGITGTHMKVTYKGVEEHDHEHHHEHHHHHASFADVCGIIDRLNISHQVKENAKAVYRLIAEAESHAHGEPIEQIHFHEVGTMDAIADVTAVSLLIEKVGAQRIIASPVNTGRGSVKCAHGILPVPAPATAYILHGIPSYNNDIEGELCTPTGAALLKHFAKEFGSMPPKALDKIGYGMGSKDFPVANCVRAMLGVDNMKDLVVELACQVDDMTGEEIGYAIEQLISEGARDAFAAPIVMKKGRPGHLITVICDRENKNEMITSIFKHTSTIGIKESEHARYVMDRTIETVDTEFGPMRRKVSTGYGVTRIKYEHDDIARVALEHKYTLREVIDKITK